MFGSKNLNFGFIQMFLNLLNYSFNKIQCLGTEIKEFSMMYNLIFRYLNIIKNPNHLTNSYEQLN